MLVQSNAALRFMTLTPLAGLKRPRVEILGAAEQHVGDSDIRRRHLVKAPSHEARIGWSNDFPERFEVLNKIGEGSFGTVWTGQERDENKKMEPLVALKRINPTCSPSR